MASKTTCPVTRSQFITKAPALSVTIFGQPFGAAARGFDSSSVGYYVNGKITVMVDGVPVTCQVGLNITAVGSKDLPKEATTRPGISKEVQAIRDAAKAKEAAEELARLEAATAPAA